MSSWEFLIVGSFGAVGAAMAVGTGAALWRHHRGLPLPGQVELTRGKVVALYLRIVVGIVVAVIGFGSLSRAGLL